MPLRSSCNMRESRMSKAPIPGGSLSRRSLIAASASSLENPISSARAAASRGKNPLSSSSPAKNANALAAPSLGASRFASLRRCSRREILSGIELSAKSRRAAASFAASESEDSPYPSSKSENSPSAGPPTDCGRSAKSSAETSSSSGLVRSWAETSPAKSSAEAWRISRLFFSCGVSASPCSTRCVCFISGGIARFKKRKFFTSNRRPPSSIKNRKLFFVARPLPKERIARIWNATPASPPQSGARK